MKKIVSQLVVAVVCALLGFLLTYQFKLLNTKNENKTIAQNQDILGEIDRLKKEKEDLIQTNTTLSEELKRLEETATKSGELEGEIKKQLDNTRMQLGTLDVKGPGIILTITPKTDIFSSNGVESTRELTEEELVYLVNVLWYSRAEAISINDTRITSQTGIKTSGKSISIGSVGKVDPKDKIVIKVIGDKAKLTNGVNYGGTLQYGALKHYSIDVKSNDDIVISKTAQGSRNEYLKPVQ